MFGEVARSVVSTISDSGPWSEFLNEAVEYNSETARDLKPLSVTMALMIVDAGWVHS